MTLKHLIKLCKDNNVPEDAILISDSGWEGGPTHTDGVYFNDELNGIILTQYDPRLPKEARYYLYVNNGTKNYDPHFWERLSELPERWHKMVHADNTRRVYKFVLLKEKGEADD